MFLNTVCQALGRAKVPYALVGGYAVALHGAVRGTTDVDFVLKWSLSNLKKAEAALKELGLVSRIPVDAETVFQFREEYIHNRNLIAWNFYDPSNATHEVDIIINYDLAGAQADIVRTVGGSVKVLSRKDLIAMKKASGRPQDLEDVRALEGR